MANGSASVWLTVKIPRALKEALAAEAQRTGENMSVVARDALRTRLAPGFSSAQEQPSCGLLPHNEG